MGFIEDRAPCECLHWKAAHPSGPCTATVSNVVDETYKVVVKDASGKDVEQEFSKKTTKVSPCPCVGFTEKTS